MSDDILWLPLADIVKRDKNADGSVTVTGVVSSPTQDLDRQIMDPDFLKRAATDWFTKRANIREMHQPLAVGKGKELTTDPNGLLVLTSKIIEPSTVKKVEEGVLSAYSVGIKNARVVRDAAAPGGRVVDGTMVECSLVDYPAADVGKFTIAKAASPDEDTGAVALTEDELTTLDETLVAKEEKAANPATTGLTPDDLRAAALARNPNVSEADLNALLEAYQAICSPNLEAGGIEGEHAEEAEEPTAASDPDAGASATAASGQQARAGEETDETRAQKLTAEELAGSIKAALADEMKSADIRNALADVAKAAVADTVKAAVQEATSGLVDRIAKLEKSPRPEGPYVGPAERTSSLDRAFPVTRTEPVTKAADPIRSRLERIAESDDPVTRAAAREALAGMA